ncbi:MAG TPA: hypothetical protein PLF11_08325 [Bacillota bacterium]|nr:hypothetical protein [Bacillota bacterium]
MSSLKMIEKRQLELWLCMSSGYVLDFTNDSFGEFFREYANVEIYSINYGLPGNSKAKRLRAFWKLESDELVGKVLEGLLEYWTYKTPQPTPEDAARADSCRRIAERLLGRRVDSPTSEEQFLKQDFGAVSLKNVPVDPQLLPILQSRAQEASRCLQNGAPLAAIFLCGSILEGLLLDVACARPKEFNQAPNSPKDKIGKVKAFQDWRLAELIDVACTVGCLTLDVKEFSHALRDFRNYIHPREQMCSQFNPDKHTAEICHQVLKAAIACLSGSR